MTKNELIAVIAESANMTKKDAALALDVTLKSIGDAMIAGDKVQLQGFGTFEVKERAARMGKNPATGAAIEIAASRTVSFKCGKVLKDAVNGD